MNQELTVGTLSFQLAIYYYPLPDCGMFVRIIAMGVWLIGSNQIICGVEVAVLIRRR
jgi:hypothetical protein